MTDSDRPTDERERECDRCEREIHDLEPAASISFGGAVQADEIIACIDCMNILIEWWNEREQGEHD